MTRLTVPCSARTRPSSPANSRGRDRVNAIAAFFVSRRGAEDVRPQRPRIVGGALIRRCRHQLELRHRRRALAMHGAEAIGAGIAAADDDDVLAGGVDPRHIVAFAVAVLLRQVIHREVHALQLAAGHVQIARLAGAAGEQDRVELAAQIGGRDVFADVDAACGTPRLRPTADRAGD